MITRKVISNAYCEYDRESRNRFLAEFFKPYIGEKIINFGGGGKKHLKQFLPDGRTYCEIDIDGTPDIKLNLETDLPLPISDSAYNTSIATDVLEHVDNSAQVFDEMVRITSEHIIISLPNPWSNLVKYIVRYARSGHTGIQYGFPVEKPQDRHKWFFSYREAESFILEKARQHSLDIVEMFPIGFYHANLFVNAFYSILGLCCGQYVRKNLCAWSLWCVLRKPQKS